MSFLILLPGATAAGDGFSRLHERARALVARGDLKQAADVERQATRSYPGNFLAHSYLSWILWRMRNVDRAIEEGRIAAKLAPESYVCRFNLAAMLKATGRVRDAVSEFEAAIACDQSAWQARLGLAQSLAIDGKPVDALKQLQFIEKLAGANPDVWEKLGDAYLQLESHESAKHALSRALKLRPGSRFAQQRLFLSSLETSDKSKARSLEQEVLTAGGTDARIYLESERNLGDAGDPAHAGMVLREAKKAVPGALDLFEILSRIFLERALAVGDRREGAGSGALKAGALKAEWLALSLESASYCLDKHSAEGKPRLLMAAALEERGDRAGAMAELDRIWRAEPKNTLAAFARLRMRSYQNDVAGAAKRGFRLAGGAPAEVVALTCGRFRFDKLKCGCHVPIMETKWKKVPGVVFARIPNVNEPTGVVAFAGDSINTARLESAVSGLSERMTGLGTKKIHGLAGVALLATENDGISQAPLVVRLSGPDPVAP